MQLGNLNFLVFQKFKLADCFYFDVAKPPSFHNVIFVFMFYKYIYTCPMDSTMYMATIYNVNVLSY